MREICFSAIYLCEVCPVSETYSYLAIPFILTSGEFLIGLVSVSVIINRR